MDVFGNPGVLPAAIVVSSPLVATAPCTYAYGMVGVDLLEVVADVAASGVLLPVVDFAGNVGAAGAVVLKNTGDDENEPTRTC